MQENTAKELLPVSEIVKKNLMNLNYSKGRY